MPFPAVRLRRLRRSPVLREMLAETVLQPQDLIYPFFLVSGEGVIRPIASMPGIAQYSVDQVIPIIESALKLGIKAFMLFGIPPEKDAQALGANDPNGVVQHATRVLKARFGDDILILTDTCLCEYTDHGHCGIVSDAGRVLNDASVQVLAKAAVSQAEAGADVVCPSDMMDGRIEIIRNALDSNGFEDVLILAYAIKFASSFYAPFRDAAESAPAFGDRRSYQMDYRNTRDASRELAEDVAEGADLLMVKPAIAYGDVIATARRETDLPIVAYNVSGEYSMVKAAAQNGWLDEQKTVIELLTGIKRAGADCIVTYHALDVARWLSNA